MFVVVVAIGVTLLIYGTTTGKDQGGQYLVVIAVVLLVASIGVIMMAIDFWQRPPLQTSDLKVEERILEDLAAMTAEQTTIKIDRVVTERVSREGGRIEGEFRVLLSILGQRLNEELQIMVQKNSDNLTIHDSRVVERLSDLAKNMEALAAADWGTIQRSLTGDDSGSD